MNEELHFSIIESSLSHNTTIYFGQIDSRKSEVIQHQRLIQLKFSGHLRPFSTLKAAAWHRWDFLERPSNCTDLFSNFVMTQLYAIFGSQNICCGRWLFLIFSYLCLVGIIVLNHFCCTSVHFLYCTFMCTFLDCVSLV